MPPERDTPGISARHWAKPIQMASRIRSLSKLRCFEPNFSAMMKTKENRISMAAVIHRLRKESRMKSLSRNPSTLTGIVPTMTIQPMR